MAALARAGSFRAVSGAAEGPKTSMLILSRLSAMVSKVPMPGRGWNHRRTVRQQKKRPAS
jgi:hypothetical protein